MTTEPLRVNNHFLPRCYLKRFASGGKRLCVYRTLVSHESVPVWEPESPARFARVKHLYTSVRLEGLSDGFERWLAQEFESPAEEALEKATNDKAMVPEDWNRLIRFAVSLDIRTPTRMFESLESSRVAMPRLLARAVEKYSSRIALARALGLMDAEPTPLHVGRELWIMNSVHLLTSSLEKISRTGWTIVRPARGLSWITSDCPLVKLNWERPDRYTFEGGWENKGTDLLLPLGPQHLLCKLVGHRPPSRGSTLSPDLTEQVRRILAEHADQAILAHQEDVAVPTYRPREVNAEKFRARQTLLENWHETESTATDVKAWSAVWSRVLPPR